MNNMKGKYFFLDSRNNEVEIEEFDYNYVRNALLKVYDRAVSKQYIFNVVVSRKFDSLGTPTFDVRPLNLENIYYDSLNLCVLGMMLDDIYFKSLQVKNLETPPLQKEYQDFLEGRTKIQLQNATPEMPAPIQFERTEIAPDDSRLVEIAKIESDIAVNPLVALDWVQNFEVCSIELTQSTQKLSTDQMQLVQLLKNNSDYIHSVLDNLTTVLEQLFPLKPTFTQRLFGTKKEITVKSDDLGKILETLRSAVSVDANRFSGLSTVFSNIKNSIGELKENVEQGLIGCKYAIATSDEQDAWEFELRQERLMKIRATTEISEMSLSTINKKFVTDLGKLKEVQEIVVPLLIIRLQNQASNKVDEETVTIIRNLAYNESPVSFVQNKPEEPPKNP